MLSGSCSIIFTICYHGDMLQFIDSKTKDSENVVFVVTYWSQIISAALPYAWCHCNQRQHDIWYYIFFQHQKIISAFCICSFFVYSVKPWHSYGEHKVYMCRSRIELCQLFSYSNVRSAN